MCREHNGNPMKSLSGRAGIFPVFLIITRTGDLYPGKKLYNGFPLV
jgi:hypothetical protein